MADESKTFWTHQRIREFNKMPFGWYDDDNLYYVSVKHMYVYIYKDKSVNNIRNCRLLKFKLIMATEVTLRLIKLNKTKYEKTSNVYIFLPPNVYSMTCT